MADSGKDDWVTPKDDWVTPGATAGSTAPSVQTEDVPGGTAPILGPHEAVGLLHGVLEVPEEAVRLGSHLIPGVPNVKANWFPSLGKYAEQTQGGRLGETAGSVLPFLVPGPDIAEGMTEAPRAARLAVHLLQHGVVPSALQPTDPNTPHFWTDKGLQVLMGTGLAGLLHTIPAAGGAMLRRVGRGTLEEAARLKSAYEKEVEDWLKMKGESEKAAQLHAQAVSDRLWRNERAEAMADDLTHAARVRHQKALADWQAAQAAKTGAPAQATREMLQRALDRVGLGNQMPQTLNRETAAKVLHAIGDEINKVHAQMRVVGVDPAFQRSLQTLVARSGADPKGLATVPQQYRDIFTRETRKYLRRLATSPNLSGDGFKNFMSDLNDTIQHYGRLAQAGEHGEAYRAIASGLRVFYNRILDEADRATMNPDLTQRRAQLNAAYSLARRVMDASDVAGVATPRNILNVMAKRQGPFVFALGRQGGDPLAAEKNRLTELMRQHEAIIGSPPAPPTPIKPDLLPEPRSTAKPVPPPPERPGKVRFAGRRERPPGSREPELPHTVRRGAEMLAHSVGGHPARAVAYLGGASSHALPALRWAARQARRLQRAEPAIAALSAQGGHRDEPEGNR